MQTYLYIHKENTGIPQVQYRGKYLLKHLDYDLCRSVGRKGEIISDVRGGEIRVVIDGFADATLLAWVFDPCRKENGSIVTMDEYEQDIAQLCFTGASAKNFRVNYDSRVKEGVSTILTLEVKEMMTDHDLHFENR